jgi:hypothetical protein
VKIICIPPNGSLLSICRRACADPCASGREWHALGQPERTASALTRGVLLANLVLPARLLAAHGRGVRVRQGRAAWPRIRTTRTSTADAYLGLNGPAEAAPAAHEATRLLPNDPDARRNLARALDRLGR